MVHLTPHWQTLGISGMVYYDKWVILDKLLATMTYIIPWWLFWQNGCQNKHIIYKLITSFKIHTKWFTDLYDCWITLLASILTCTTITMKQNNWPILIPGFSIGTRAQEVLNSFMEMKYYNMLPPAILKNNFSSVKCNILLWCKCIAGGVFRNSGNYSMSYAFIYF